MKFSDFLIMEKEILFELAEKLSKYDWKVGSEIEGKLVFVRVSGESERYPKWFKLSGFNLFFFTKTGFSTISVESVKMKFAAPMAHFFGKNWM